MAHNSTVIIKTTPKEETEETINCIKAATKEEKSGPGGTIREKLLQDPAPMFESI